MTKKIELSSIRETIDTHPHVYEEGFTREEIYRLLSKFTGISREKFWDNVGVVTCLMKDGNVVYFIDDIELAIRCTLENRKPTIYEFD